MGDEVGGVAGMLERSGQLGKLGRDLAHSDGNLGRPQLQDRDRLEKRLTDGRHGAPPLANHDLAFPSIPIARRSEAKAHALPRNSAVPATRRE